MSAESFALAAAQVEPVYHDREGALAKTCRWIELMIDLQKHNLHELMVFLQKHNPPSTTRSRCSARPSRTSPGPWQVTESEGTASGEDYSIRRN